MGQLQVNNPSRYAYRHLRETDEFTNTRNIRISVKCSVK